MGDKAVDWDFRLVAGPFGFTAQPFFEIQDAAQREVPQVKFT